MFTVSLRNAEHTREYSIRSRGIAGWQVKVEADHEVARETWYHDWHRVERALDEFAREVQTLTEQGWTLQGSPLGVAN
jgi:hypothetical protein